jgi:hypothetical protein
MFIVSSNNYKTGQLRLLVGTMKLHTELMKHNKGESVIEWMAKQCLRAHADYVINAKHKYSAI